MESQTGSGSHFWIDVPFMLAEQQLQDESTMASNIIAFADPFVRHRARVRPMRVLVADDQSANLMVLRRLLEKAGHRPQIRSEEHTSELQSLMRNSYAVFCLKKKNHIKH